MYIYHDKIKDEYYKFGNKTDLANFSGISRNTIVNWFSRSTTKVKTNRVDDKEGRFVIVEFKKK